METIVESSGSAKPLEEEELEPWAKLVPLDSKYSDIDIQSTEMVIRSELTNTSVEKQEWCTITRNLDLYSAMVENLRSCMIMVDGTVIGKGDSAVVRCGTEVVSGPNKEGYLTYKFKVMPVEEHRKKKLKIPFEVEHAKCNICVNIWHDVVTVSPCLHNFCNGCFSEWLKRSQVEFQNVVCPQCHATVHSVGRNQFLHDIAEGILENDSSLRRSKEEFALLDASAMINSDLILKRGRTSRQKRPLPPPDEESNDTELSCPQCDTEMGGFQCKETTSHLQCQACGGRMPSRSDIGVPQNCLGCGSTFCGAYWQNQGLVPGDLYQLCTHENFKPISERTIVRIPFYTHQSNQYEKEVTNWCIRQMDRTLQEVVSDLVVKFNNRELDRTRMPLNHAEMISGTTHLCNSCFDELISFLLYWFRLSTPKSLLPPEASTRENCWYGYSCRTQHKSEEHARKRNHVCRPTRGNIISSLDKLLEHQQCSTRRHDDKSYKNGYETGYNLHTFQLLPPEASTRENCRYGYACRT